MINFHLITLYLHQLFVSINMCWLVASYWLVVIVCHVLWTTLVCMGASCSSGVASTKPAEFLQVFIIFQDCFTLLQYHYKHKGVAVVFLHSDDKVGWQPSRVIYYHLSSSVLVCEAFDGISLFVEEGIELLSLSWIKQWLVCLSCYHFLQWSYNCWTVFKSSTSLPLAKFDKPLGISKQTSLLPEIWLWIF